MISLAKAFKKKGLQISLSSGFALGFMGLFYFLWRRYASRVQHKRTKKIENTNSAKFLLQSKKVDPCQQTLAEGTGPFFHRIYKARIKTSTHNAKTLIKDIKTNIDRYSASELATFKKTKGNPQLFSVGDYYDIHISGPWDGPVLVLRHDSESFTFATRQGHLEAGEIRFSAKNQQKKGKSYLLFQIESWSRSKDAAVDLVYDKLKLAQMAQTSMWVVFCKNVASRSQGQLVGDIKVSTQKTEINENE